MTPETPAHDAAERVARELVLAWANEDTYVGGEPSKREQDRLIARVKEALLTHAREARRGAFDEAAKMADSWPAECHTDPDISCGPGIAAAIHARAQEGTNG